jgi:hypothetical protein
LKDLKYQIEVINDKLIFFTISKKFLKYLTTKEAQKLLLPVILSLQFPTYCLVDNEVHSRHWTVRRRLKNLKELGKTFTTTGINLDLQDIPFYYLSNQSKEFRYEYTFY